MAKRKIQPSTPEITVLKKPKAIFKEELKGRILLGENLLSREIKTIAELEQLREDYDTWADYNRELLRRSFNRNQNEYYESYENCTQMIGFEDAIYRRDTSSNEYQLNNVREKIGTAKINLERLVEKLPLIDERDNIQECNTTERTFTNKCFIVHGHDDAKKFEIARFIENDLRKKAIILHEKANQGRTIIEKFEKYSRVDFAVALWTADDQGKAKSATELSDRARQNVIFETGFFIGKLGRENVIVLYENGVEIPSDYSGVVFISLVDNWKDDLRKEIEAIYDSL